MSNYDLTETVTLTRENYDKLQAEARAFRNHERECERVMRATAKALCPKRDDETDSQWAERYWNKEGTLTIAITAVESTTGGAA